MTSSANGSNNIYIGNAGATESNRIRIGTQGTQSDAFIAGISGNTVAGSPVIVTASGELGVATSSIRFKQAVRDMGDTSRVLMELRPVAFRYREEVVGEADAGIDQYGLIAEEVAKVDSRLVAYDEDGKPHTVHYQFLSPMLLNEVQRQERTIQEQREGLEEQAALIEQLTARLEAVESQLGRAAR